MNFLLSFQLGTNKTKSRKIYSLEIQARSQEAPSAIRVQNLLSFCGFGEIDWIICPNLPRVRREKFTRRSGSQSIESKCATL